MEANGRNIEEFYNIQSISNIESILRLGILSFNKSSNVNHDSIASMLVQGRRNKSVPNGSNLHDYACLYFDARNTMMFKIKYRSDICVLRVSEDVINLEGTVVTDRNAACDFVNFYTIDEIRKLDFDTIFMRDWRSDNQSEYWWNRKVKCAEILVKNKVPSEYIIGAYVKNTTAQNSLEEQGFDKPIEINRDMFFLGEG